jgi:SAM-dependent methyltransferase
MADWYADDAFWQLFFPSMFPEERFEGAAEQVEKIIALIGFKGESVLDLACGPGRHTVALAQKGFRVTGVDLSTFLLEKAMARGEAARVNVEWIHQDMRRFRRPGAFDLCLSLFTSFGYFEDKNDDLVVLRNIHDSLADGGTFLIDVMGKEVLAKQFQPTTAAELADGSLLIQRHEIFDDWTRIRNHWILLREGKAHDYRFYHTVYSAQELRDRLRIAGFTSVSIYGDLDGNPYGPDARRLVVAARK